MAPSDLSSKDSPDPAPGQSEPAKKPYQRPVLVRWGSLRDLTQAIGNSGASDGSKGKTNNRTGRGGHYGDYWK